ncbi:hypothetical protein ScPMuIL_000400 [Solemya velum]
MISLIANPGEKDCRDEGGRCQSNGVPCENGTIMTGLCLWGAKIKKECCVKDLDLTCIEKGGTCQHRVHVACRPPTSLGYFSGECDKGYTGKRKCCRDKWLQLIVRLRSLKLLNRHWTRGHIIDSYLETAIRNTSRQRLHTGTMADKVPMTTKEREKLIESSSRPMSEEERRELMRKLDEDLDAFVKHAQEKGKKETPSENKSIDELVHELKQHPAFLEEIDYSQPLSPDIEALMALKFESEDSTANAESYKEDGNYEFKKKAYRVAADNYTTGIKCASPNRELNAVLYTNRAATQFHLGNYRSSIQDCVFARRFKPDHFKAIMRGALCCMELKKAEDTIQWCDAGLLLQPKNEKLLEMRLRADKLLRSQERDRRKEAVKERKENEEERKLLTAIQSRGIRLAGIKKEQAEKLDPLLLSSLETQHPGGCKVHLDDNGSLHWPVLLLYPEYCETDLIQACAENSRLIDHINHMFGPDVEPAPWDKDRTYTPDKLEVYFEDREKEKLYKVDKSNTLLKCLQHKKYTVHGGTPTFILLVRNSKFRDIFLGRYKT